MYSWHQSGIEIASPMPYNPQPMTEELEIDRLEGYALQ